MPHNKLQSWGNYPQHTQRAHAKYYRDDIFDLWQQLKKNHNHTLAFGNGRSYGDSCLAASNHTIYSRHFNRFIEADWENGIIKVEAGTTIEEVLNLCIHKGWFVPVTPGTKYVTIGGALANDVHGKNHHIHGTFGCNVTKFSLLRSNDNQQIICSLEQNQDLFQATIGGLGLTGIILWVEFKLIKITSSFIDKTIVRFDSLKEFFDISNELDSEYDYTVSWIDCATKSNKIGRGVFFAGNHSKEHNLQVIDKKKISVPFAPPFSLINRFSLKILNELYFHLHPKNKKVTSNYNNFFYPLDHLSHWNKAYGKKGFQQYQCVIPKHEAQDAITELLDIISANRAGSFLAVLKNFGNIKSPGILSFPLQGTSLALDFPQNNCLENLFSKLDQIVFKSKGRLYPAKDAHMSSIHFQSFYPDWKKVEDLRDPALYSHFWKRVTQ
jgi:FAD/FMN-containing dehydrogenase